MALVRGTFSLLGSSTYLLFISVGMWEGFKQKQMQLRINRLHLLSQTVIISMLVSCYLQSFNCTAGYDITVFQNWLSGPGGQYTEQPRSGVAKIVMSSCTVVKGDCQRIHRKKNMPLKREIFSSPNHDCGISSSLLSLKRQPPELSNE